VHAAKNPERAVLGKVSTLYKRNDIIYTIVAQRLALCPARREAAVSAEYWWAGRDNATLTESVLSQETCMKTRTLPSSGPTTTPALHQRKICLANRMQVWPRRSLWGIG